MGRISAAAQGAAFFLIAIVSSPAQACENCQRAPATAPKTVRLDVTAAVDTATSFVIKTLRTLKPSYQVFVVEGDELEAPPTVAEYAAYYHEQEDDSGRQRSDELPGFQHRSAWELTYRDEGLEVARPFEPMPGTDVTLDDSWVLGLRFELAYGWKR
ncbi:hypothetical protein JM946_21100 [Steroidobacter sp. S1-65]|uniref:Uncharacterized protein n=1 Tax=Steroidobacter gossypii TaxID=2805490 RepID=A0ABS1X213_9GAMM|nr:hypothetical protein [Steroidobacter gossypii]MBM0107242.1 hypothetical protein [Steroidobacter gossypii]